MGWAAGSGRGPGLRTTEMVYSGIEAEVVRVVDEAVEMGAGRGLGEVGGCSSPQLMRE